MEYPTCMSVYLLNCDVDCYQIAGDKLADNVYKGVYLSTGQTVSIKMHELDNLSNDEVENIKEGIRINRQLKHQNILPFLACFVNNYNLWLVTPYCHHGSSSDISKPAGLCEKAIAFIVKDVLAALDYLHNQGIIHRAVRGQHILIYGPQGRCLLTGFQYSISVLDNGKFLPFVHAYPANAKPNLNWLSPELLEQNLLGYCFKSDIYSLGITCCELANGCIPFANLQPTEMLLDKLTGNYPRPIDSTCSELKDLVLNDLSGAEKRKYDIYRTRRFSDHFHTFCEDLCLSSDPHKRPSASQLISHKFFKQLKKLDPSATLLTVLKGN